MTSSRARPVRSLRRVAVLLMALTAALGFTAWRRPPAPPPPGGRADGGIPECPGDGFRVTIDTGHAAVTLTQLPLVEPITDIPEFHDCQRFIKRDGSYDTRYAIFAIAKLDSLAQHWPGDSARSPRPYQRVSRTAAVIYSWGGSYPPLGIGRGFNCLLMYRDPSFNWQATMLPQGPDQPRCPERVAGAVAGEVRLRTNQLPPLPGYSDTDYPPVARWDWDSTNSQQYISIKCGAAWCEIGSYPGLAGMTGMRATATFPSNVGPTSVPPTHRSRTVEIRGWYDLQQLAVALPGGGVQPGRIRGTVYPAKGLGQYNATSDFAPATAPRPWTVSAYALMQADYINNKVQFTRGLNTVSLCFGDRATCRVPEAGLPVKCRSGAWTWWAKTESQSGRPRYTCVTQTTHQHVEIPATVRWRWDENDETMWIRCTQGCCKLEG